MRAAWIAIVVLTAAAGCLGGPQAEPAPTPAPTPTPSATPSPATPTPTPTPEPTVPSPSPIPPEPKVVYQRTFDFSTEGDATGQSPRVETSERVGAEFSRLTVNVSIERASATPTSLPVSGTVHEPTVRVLDPDGSEVFAATGEGTQRVETFGSKVGAYEIRYEGAGTLRAIVTLTAAS